ncbi:MAG: glutamate--tRNA ligase [Candidatus Margulisiibacteriota bacterium]|nr:MAG: glutamate--tRNA ligase [Candidatus Margulisbacteria bacterium GWF2_38_17]OGI06524.1 MAG: glutamate--tRNA ligase [Candidatus Margulisbacteria bacterium GWE2_39_32]PZM83222.1 MAG: glutamate--tRNA ligase [Candidatus Margulisiibacteriota bacterium]HCT84158.1 glutamate--tRNA ligase [Candidatus Margulisiibacteriota bacterium]HCY37387.1 glutamate--tRNA ligase [Candidatus Margulisiibacteriota bacterium]
MARVRFAPSPTGNLHIGSVRTALFNWLYAKRVNGSYILRIEDTDLQRSTKEYEDNILAGLKWLGLEWDEGPGKEDSVRYRQTERIAQHVYVPFVEKLLEQDDAYYCYCTPEELEKEKALSAAQGLAPGYTGKCRNLTSEQSEQYKAEGRACAVRFRVKPEKIIVKDIIRGNVEFDTNLINDFVIQKADGSPAYNFAVVVDDIAMRITHVIRGEDHLPNTPKQIMLYNALSSNLPEFAHLPMILGPDKSKLSKRHGATSVVEYQEQGFLPEALINYLSLLGWSHPEGKEKMPVQEIINNFHIERISKSGAVFDVEKLRWMNGLYVRELPEEKLVKAVMPFLIRAYGSSVEEKSQEWLSEVIQSVRDNLTVLTDIVSATSVYFVAKPEYQPDFILKYLHDDLSKSIITDVINTFTSLSVYSEEVIKDYINALPVKYSCGKGKVLKPLRYAVSGQEHGPLFVKLLYLLGRETVVDRLKKALDM